MNATEEPKEEIDLDARPCGGFRITNRDRLALKEIAKENCNTFNGVVELAVKQFIERERGIRQ